MLKSKLFSSLAAKLVGLLLALASINCSGKTYSTFMQPFDLVFGGSKTTANPAVTIALTSATPLTPTRLKLALSKPVSLTTGENPSNFVIKDANGATIDVVAVTRDPFDSSVVYIDTSLQVAGTVYTITASNLVGVDGAILNSSANTASWTGPNNVDSTPPTINSAAATSTTVVELTFSEALDLTSSTNTANYKLYTTSGACTADGATAIAVNSVSRSSTNFAKISVTFNSAPAASPQTYYIRANSSATGVKDQWGNVVTSGTSCSPVFTGLPAAVAPKVASALSQSSTSLTVTFDQAMTNNAALTTAGNYVLSGCGALASTGATVTRLSATQVALSSLTAGTSGSCKITVNTAITGTSGTALSATNNVAYFNYSTTDSTGPVVTSVTATSSTNVRVTFNEPINDTTAVAGNFSFSPSLTVSGVTCGVSAGNYTYCDVATAATPQTTQSYALAVSGIQDIAGNTMTSSSTTFTGDGKPYIIAIIPIDSSTVRVQWSESILAAGVDIGDYTINGVTLPNAPWTGSTATIFPAGATSSDMVTLNLAGTTLTSGTNYTLGYSDGGTAQTDTTPTTPNGVVAPMTLPNGGVFTGPSLPQQPFVTGITSGSTTSIQVTFNKALDNSTLAIGDFTLAGAAGCPANPITSVTQVSAGVVQLTVAAGAGGTGITCTVAMAAAAVGDLTGNTNAIMGATNYTYTGTAGAADTTAPTITSIVPVSNTRFVVNFSETVTGASGQSLANYSFSPSMSGFPTGASISCTGAVCTVDIPAPGMSAVSYTATVTGVQDGSANASASATATFTGIGSSSASPTMYLATLINPTTLEVSFSEAMNLTTVETTGSYSVTGSNSVTAAVRQSDPTKVRLTLSPGAFGSGTTFTVTGTTAITDVAGNALAAPLSATFAGSGNAPGTAPDLAATSDKGVSSTDDNTGAGLFPAPPGMVFTGTVAANTIVVIYDGGVAVGSTTSDASGNYSVTISTAPSEGAHTYTIGTVSSTGVASDPSPTISVTFDSIAPAAPAAAIDLATASDTGSSTTDNITRTANGLVFTGSGAVAGATVRIYAGATEIGTATADGAGAWSITTTVALSEGANTITYKIEDLAGNLSNTSTSNLSVTLDTTAPVATGAPDLVIASDTGSSTTDNLTSDTTPTFDVSCVNGESVQLYDGATATGTPVICALNTAAVTTAALTDGSHTITAIQTDTAGNASVASTGLTVTIDSAVPGTPAAPVFATADDTGTASNDGITSTTTNLTFTGTVEANARVDIYDGGGSLANVVADGSGNYTIDIPGPLGAGAHSITVRAQDASGNQTAATAATAITVDATAGTVTNVTSSLADGTYGIGQVVPIQVTFSEIMVVTGTPAITLTTLTPATTTAINYTSGSGTNTLTFNYTVASGDTNTDLNYAATNSLAGTIADMAGNAATLTLPGLAAAGSLAINKALNINGVINGTITYAQGANTAGPFKAGSLTITATYASAPGSAPTIAINQQGTNDLVATAMSGGPLIYTYTYTVNAVNAPTDVDGTATITLSTASTPASPTFTIDTTADAAPGAPDLQTASDLGSSNSDNITSTTTPSFTVSCVTGSSVQLYDGASATGSAVTCAGSTATLTAAALSEGTHASMNAIQTDPAGNASPASGNLSVTIDATADAAPGAPDLQTASDTGSSNSDNITSSTTPSFDVSCVNGSSVQLFDGAAATGSAVTCAGGTATLTAAALSAGAHASMNAKQTDAAGNLSAASGNLSITIDATADAAPGTPDLQTASDTGSSTTDNITTSTTPSFDVSCVNGSSVQLFDNLTATGSAVTCASGTATLTAAALSAGVHASMNAKQTDAAGNVSLASGNLSITIDSTADAAPGTPDLQTASDTGTSTSDDTTKTNTPSFTVSCVTGSSVQLYDNVTASGTAVTCAASTATLTAATLSDGTHATINAKQTDPAGNVSVASGNLSVTIDTAAPTNQDTVYAASSAKNGGGSVTIVSSGTASNEVWFAPAGTTTFTAGATMTKAASGTATSMLAPATAGSYKLYVLDLAGNISSESTAILTVDNTAPTAAITYSVAGPYKSGASVTITATFSEAVADSPVPQISISGSNTVAATNMTKTSTTVYTYVHTVGAGDGTATVAMATTTDNAGNAVTTAPTSGATFTVDNTAPVVSNVTSSTANGSYVAGNTISIQVNFDSTVTVTGFPQLTLETGTTDAVVNYVSGSPGTSLTFTYTVGASDASADLDYASTGALALNGGTIVDAAGNAATLTLPATGSANSIAGSKALVVGVVSFDISSAETLDCDPVDGHIDHYKVALSAAALDSSMDGYALNARGTVTTTWLISGYASVQMDHGTALPVACGTDTANDSTIYLKFAPIVAYDTGVKPDLTGSSTVLTNAGGTKLNSNTGTWGSAAVTETDKAAPQLYGVTGLAGANNLALLFSESVDTDSTLGCASTLTKADFTYNNVFVTGATSMLIESSWVDTNGCDNSSVITKLDAVLATGDLSNDSVVPASATSVYDAAGNAMPTTTLVTSTSAQPTIVSASSLAPTTVRVTYSENVLSAEATVAANYKIVTTETGTCAAGTNFTGSTQTGDFSISSVAQVSANVYDLTLSATQVGGTNYILIGSLTGVHDTNENAVLGCVNKATFVGNESIKMLSAQKVTDASGSFAVFSVTFSKAVALGGNNGANVLVNYSFPAGLNTVTLCTSTDDAACPASYTAGVSTTIFFKATPEPAQGAYTVVGATAAGTPSGALGCILNDGGASPTNCLQVNPNDRASVNFGLPSDIQAGPVYTDPFNDGVTLSGQVIIYNNKLVIGPNNYDSGLFQTNIDLTNSSSVTLDADNGFAGNQPFGRRTLTGTLSGTNASTTVNGSGTSFTTEVVAGQYIKIGSANYVQVTVVTDNVTMTVASALSATQTNQAATVAIREDTAGNNMLAGIDYMYAGCYDDTSPYASTTLTGTNCTSAGGTEYLFIVGFNTTATTSGYQSNWNTTSTTSPFVFNHLTGFSNSATRTYRAMSAIIYKGWVYQASQHQTGSYAVRWNRFKPGAANPCPGGGTPGGANNASSDCFTMAGSYLNKIGEAGTVNNGQAPATDGLISIDTMYEHDDDAGGALYSALYIANGGSCTGTCLSGDRVNNTTRSDGGVLRTVQGASDTTPPGNCTSAANCNTIWEDVTPSVAKWYTYMSKPLPQDARGGGVCGTIEGGGTTEDWDCLVPQNTIIPAIKAIPKMVTFNGHLFMIRNACSSTSVQTLTATQKSTCASGTEIPQLWKLPASTGSAATARGAWVLVAENGTTGRTDMTGVEWLGGTSQSTKTANNREITMLLVNGSRLYIGFDNPVDGANTWRTKSGVTNPTSESDFEAVCETGHSCFTVGLQFGWGYSVTKIFDSLSVNDAGNDYVIITARTGTSPLQIYRQSNN